MSVSLRLCASARQFIASSLNLIPSGSGGNKSIMIISIIAAMDENASSAREQAPCICRRLRRFRKLTLGHRSSWTKDLREHRQAAGRPENIVITRQALYRAKVRCRPQPLRRLRRMRRRGRVFVLAGRHCSRCPALADRVYLTVVRTRVEGDALFPLSR